jgi:hypothetical protein
MDATPGALCQLDRLVRLACDSLSLMWVGVLTVGIFEVQIFHASREKKPPSLFPLGNPRVRGVRADMWIVVMGVWVNSRDHLGSFGKIQLLRHRTQ